MLQEYRLLPYVDRWVVSRLATWVQESRARTTPGWPVPANGVNLSEDTLREPKFADFGSRSVSSERDRKSTRLNSSHGYISYAVFCLKKKKQIQKKPPLRADVRHAFAVPYVHRQPEPRPGLH